MIENSTKTQYQMFKMTYGTVKLYLQLIPVTLKKAGKG